MDYLNARAEFEMMRKDAEGGVGGGLLVYDESRLSRDQEELRRIRELLAQNGTPVISVEQV